MYNNEESFEEYIKKNYYDEDYRESLSREQWVEEMEIMLLDMKQREQEVIRLRLGMLGEEAKTRQQVADAYGVSSERIGFIERKFLRRFRCRRRDSDKLRKFLAE